MSITTLRETVAAQLAGISPDVEARVIEHFVATETSKRADAIVRGIDSLAALQRDFAKMRPDAGGYFDATGTEVKATGFTKATHDARAKLQGKIEKMTKALDKAISGEMGDLTNLNKGGDRPDRDDAE